MDRLESQNETRKERRKHRRRRATPPALAGAVATLIFGATGWEPEPEVVAAATTVLAFVASFFLDE